jgi:hypothetical protein
MAITEVSICRECLAKLLEGFVGRKQRWAESASIDALIRAAHRDSGVVLCVWSEGNWIITRFGMSPPISPGPSDGVERCAPDNVVDVCPFKSISSTAARLLRIA